MASKQGFTYSSTPPVVCACGRRFQPSSVIDHAGGTKHVNTCPPCTKAEKRAKRRKKQQG